MVRATPRISRDCISPIQTPGGFLRPLRAGEVPSLSRNARRTPLRLRPGGRLLDRRLDLNAGDRSGTRRSAWTSSNNRWTRPGCVAPSSPGCVFSACGYPANGPTALRPDRIVGGALLLVTGRHRVVCRPCDDKPSTRRKGPPGQLAWADRTIPARVMRRRSVSSPRRQGR